MPSGDEISFVSKHTEIIQKCILMDALHCRGGVCVRCHCGPGPRPGLGPGRLIQTPRRLDSNHTLLRINVLFPF